MDHQQAPIVIVVLGPPGAGKGTQSGMLAGRLRVPHISIGSLLRSHARDNSEAGSSLNSTMALGSLVPDSLVLEVLATRISKPDCAQGLILDGFPRTLRQAEFLERGLLAPRYSNNERGKLIALYLRVQHRTIVGRVSGRRICSRCGATYHLDSQPPRVSGECDFDGSALTIREDDRKATVLKRLQLYERQTVPILNHYAERASLVEIDAEQSRENIVQKSLQRFIAGSACPAQTMSRQVLRTMLQTDAIAHRRKYLEYRGSESSATNAPEGARCHIGQLTL